MRYNGGMENKQPVSFRLTPEAIKLIKKLAKNLGVSQASIIEIAVRIAYDGQPRMIQQNLTRQNQDAK